MSIYPFPQISTVLHLTIFLSLMGMRCNTILTKPIHSFKCHLLYKPTFIFCCATKNRVHRWYNPNTKRKSDQLEMITPHWVQLNSPLPSISQEKFTVVSYNVLGDKNARKHRDLYSLIPPEYLEWDRRKKLICEELIERDSDIICLHEVDKYDDLLEIMEKQGYTGSFKQRSGGAVDGCAMFWKADKFCLLEGESIEFKDFDLRDNVAQIYVFEMCRDDSRRVLVGNIHVLFNPSREDIKLGQIRLLLFINKIWSEEERISATGDANITVAEHPLKLKSSYASVKNFEGPLNTRDIYGEPLATSFHSKFLGTVDYLWYSEGLVPSRVLNTPPLDLLRETQGLPNKTPGSDHLPIISEYAFRL